MTQPPSTLPAEVPAAQVSSAPALDIPLWRSGLLLGLALLVYLSYLASPDIVVSQNAGVIMELPNQVIPFDGFPGEITEVERRILPKDTEFARKIYDDHVGHNIVCSIILNGAIQQSIHRPEVCLVAQGWSPIRQEDITIKLKSGHDLTVRSLRLRRENPLPNGGKQVREGYFIYWFIGENTTTSSHFMRFFLSNWDRIFHNRSHRWAYVTVSAPILLGSPDDADAKRAQAMMLNFIREIVPSFQKSEMTPGGTE